jgi:hypothetical protein
METEDPGKPKFRFQTSKLAKNSGELLGKHRLSETDQIRFFCDNVLLRSQHPNSHRADCTFVGFCRNKHSDSRPAMGLEQKQQRDKQLILLNTALDSKHVKV